MDQLRTERLLLRRWAASDREPFAALNADPVVMEHFPAVLDRAQSDAMVDRIEAGFDALGYGLWAVEHDGAFVGFTGLAAPAFRAGFLPSVEIGWRLTRTAWGRGLATEAATAVLAAAFGPLGLAEVVSFTATSNTRSERVMQRLGLTPAGEFDHPQVEAGHRLRRHVLYRADAASWVRPPAAR